ncbi:MAG: hypothetical protein AUJ75_01705 [Candidatus Omnitrophica bacterium CG1_02_49_10]|nr:MAG: hypothetical protein AUJ75_01705 [Candidatus Omnitrophica bacterium CG1_02_49_10]
MGELLKEGKKVYSVSEITRDIRTFLEERFSALWIEGEVTDFKHHTSGHMYFTIKDDKAQMRSVIFKRDNEALKFQLKNGLAVLCFGRIGVYDKQGQYQLYVETIEPKGVGALKLAFEQLKGRLAKEGLFDAAHKKTLPMLPSRIGVVTSPTGAAVRDIINVLTRRFGNIEIIINPVPVQGKGAALKIAEAIDELDNISKVTAGAIDKIDVIIVGRGGGSLEDLWAFNEEPVARAIYRAKTPVISAVGHEIDFTISDYVADLRAATPSAAAEIVVGRKDSFLEMVGSLERRIIIQIKHSIEYYAERSRGIIKRLSLLAPSEIIKRYQQEVDGIIERAKHSLMHTIEILRSQLANSSDRLSCLNPIAILSRGYSITVMASSGDILKKRSSVKKGDEIKTILSEGEIISEVK